MRQLCNISYTVQAEGFVEEDEFEEWDRMLPVPPGAPPPRRRNTKVADEHASGALGYGGLGNV